MPETARQQKITFGEMRGSGVRGVRVCCSARINGRMVSGFPTSPVRLAVGGAPTCARTFFGKRSDPLED
jgi:hypothetical protein